MKLQINKAPLTADLYLRRCNDRKNSKACKRIDLFERIYRGTLLSFAGIALAFCGVALVQITIILSK